MKENSNERAEPVAGEPNFCENCAMDLLTCDCVVKRPVHLETATDPDCAAPRVWEGDKPHGANYAGWRREVIAAQPAADNAPVAAPSQVYEAGKIADRATAPVPVAEPVASMADMRMLIQRLAHSLRRAAPDNALADQAMDYLKRMAPVGSPLRDGDQS